MFAYLGGSFIRWVVFICQVMHQVAIDQRQAEETRQLQNLTLWQKIYRLDYEWIKCYHQCSNFPIKYRNGMVIPARSLSINDRLFSLP